MAKTKTNETKKYEHQKQLAAARQRKRKANMSAEELEKKRQRDRERYYRLKEDKKIKLVSEMNPKELKEQRKKWTKIKAEQRKRKEEEKKRLQDSKETEEEQIAPTDKQTESRQKKAGRKLLRREKAKVYRELMKKTEENEALKRKLLKYKKRLEREKKKNAINDASSPTPKKRLAEVLGTEKVSPKIKKRLFVGLALEKQVKNQVRSAKAKSSCRKVVKQIIGNSILKKYRLMNQLPGIACYKTSQCSLATESVLTPPKNIYKTVRVQEAKAIIHFFQEDSVSKMMPGKKDFVRKGKIKKQRRVLLDSLLNLYKRFINEKNLQISYTTFCRSRPFWVTFLRQRDRETCACVRHENFQFLTSALKKAGAIEEENITNVVKSVVCSITKEHCMSGKCHKCQAKQIHFMIDKDVEIEYYEWTTTSKIKLIKGVEKVVKRVVKVNKIESLSTLKLKFEHDLAKFKKHLFAMRHQTYSLKSLKENLTPGQLIFQVDFSQNYVGKMTTEIQSMHFGASKRQISLHTGAMYFVGEGSEVNCKTFCTASDNLDHHAHGVWAHLHPILQAMGNTFPDTKVVHFFSDSPSSQYRNRMNIFLMQLLLPKHFKSLETFTWNFSEAGHGKGAMDGVGGSVKRNADQKVLQGHDVTSASDFVSLFKNSKTNVLEISSSSIEDMKTCLEKNIPTIKGIMAIRQIYWSAGATHMYGRRLSCFKCTEQKCSHFHVTHIPCIVSKKHKSVLKVSDVYTSSDEDSPEEIIPSSYKYEDLQQGVHVVVSFALPKKNIKKFVAVIQGEVQPDREVDVLFMERYGDDKTTFKANENDISYISCDQIVGVLPPPTIILKGDRILYKFANAISL